MKTLATLAALSLAAIPGPAIAQTTACETFDDFIPVGREFEVREEPAYVNADSVNVRSGPSVNFVVTEQATEGAYITVFGQAFDSDCETWVRVAFPVTGEIGWVHSQFVTLTYGRGWWD